MHGEQPAQGKASDEDLTDILLQCLEAEPCCGQPVLARHVEQISRSRAVSRQKHRSNQEAALCERIGQVAHRERHVGQAVQEESPPGGALVRRRWAKSRRAARSKGNRSREFQTCAVRVHVHLVAFEPFPRLPHVVVEIAITVGIERQTLPEG